MLDKFPPEADKQTLNWTVIKRELEELAISGFFPDLLTQK